MVTFRHRSLPWSSFNCVFPWYQICKDPFLVLGPKLPTLLSYHFENFAYPVGISLPTSPDKDSGDDELKDAAEDKDHAEEHPDVKERDVGDPGDTLPDLTRRMILTNDNIWISLLTELNMAVSVSRVVMPIPTLPGTDSAGINKDNQANTWTTYSRSHTYLNFVSFNLSKLLNFT